ncbi:hypothetical protein CDAR_73291 [Caerostris darwini]|uniref:Uncharacterized protein n=1 Tax=Caerostris darwini TaxID=1538125 RepID=A0AAV4VZJ0_9ARAC|nr:hypothetical protein CDAR_73291 [Caerostris darwini]
MPQTVKGQLSSRHSDVVWSSSSRGSFLQGRSNGKDSTLEVLSWGMVRQAQVGKVRIGMGKGKNLFDKDKSLQKLLVDDTYIRGGGGYKHAINHSIPVEQIVLKKR